jgi:hypothetical protein
MKMATEYKVDEHGWIPKAVADVRAGRPLVLVMDGPTAREVAGHARAAAEAVRTSGLAEVLLDKLPGSPLPIPPFDVSTVIAALAEMGALGGAAGSVAVVCALAHGLGGYTVDLTLRVPPKLTDVQGRASLFKKGEP